MVQSETRISLHYKQEGLHQKKKNTLQRGHVLLLPWPQLYITNLLSVRDWRCKKTGGAQIPVTLFTRRYMHNTHTHTFILYALLSLLLSFIDTSYESPCVSRRTQRSVGALWVTPRVLQWPFSASSLHYTQGDQNWPCLFIQNLDQLGSTCKNIATMPQKRNNPAAPVTIPQNLNSPPTKPPARGIFLQGTYF